MASEVKKIVGVLIASEVVIVSGVKGSAFRPGRAELFTATIYYFNWILGKIGRLAE